MITTSKPAKAQVFRGEKFLQAKVYLQANTDLIPQSTEDGEELSGVADGKILSILNRIFLRDDSDENLKRVEEATKHREDLEKKVFAKKPEKLAQTLIESTNLDDNTSISVEDFKGHKKKKSKKRKGDNPKETFGL